MRVGAGREVGGLAARRLRHAHAGKLNARAEVRGEARGNGERNMLRRWQVRCGEGNGLIQVPAAPRRDRGVQRTLQFVEVAEEPVAVEGTSLD